MRLPSGPMERRSRTALGAGASSCDELTEIVSSADQRPFIGHFGDAAQKKLSKASRLFDLAKDRFDDLLAQPIAAMVASAPQFASHRLHERATLWFRTTTGRMRGAANGQIGANIALR